MTNISSQFYQKFQNVFFFSQHQSIFHCVCVYTRRTLDPSVSQPHAKRPVHNIQLLLSFSLCRVLYSLTRARCRRSYVYAGYPMPIARYHESRMENDVSFRQRAALRCGDLIATRLKRAFLSLSLLLLYTSHPRFLNTLFWVRLNIYSNDKSQIFIQCEKNI